MGIGRGGENEKEGESKNVGLLPILASECVCERERVRERGNKTREKKKEGAGGREGGGKVSQTSFKPEKPFLCWKQ
jgi:hypothetical protein